jgi:hypothetical protein
MAELRTSPDLPGTAGRPLPASSRGAGCSSLLELLDPPSDFNFEHFRMRHMAAELLRTLRPEGVLPGRAAPGFALESTSGELLRLGDLRGRPVLLHLVSYT